MRTNRFFFSRGLPTYRVWLPVLTRRFGMEAVQVLLARVEGKYAELLSGSRRYSPRVLQKLHFEKNILPALSLYKILLMDEIDPSEALAILDEVLEAGVQGQKRMYKLLGRYPFFFDLLRWTLKPLMALQYPKEGWQVDYPDLGPDAVGLDSHRCFYIQVLTEYGLPELTRHFCRLDDVLYEGVSPYVSFERTQTMGRGGTMCDFRYYRVKKEKIQHEYSE